MCLLDNIAYLKINPSTFDNKILFIESILVDNNLWPKIVELEMKDFYKTCLKQQKSYGISIPLDNN